METNLKVLLSYSHKRPYLRNALKLLIPKLGPWDVVSDQDHDPNHPTPPELMKEMVKQYDVAIFLLTDDDAESLFEEMRLWLKHQSAKLQNAIVFKDPAVSANIEKKIGFNPTYIPFVADDPWSDIHVILPAIDNLLRQGSSKLRLLPWQLACHRLRRHFNWKIGANNVPMDHIEAVMRLISTKAKYSDPTKWWFRISWHTESSNIDSYSRKINCLKLLEALLETEARQDEYEFIFKAIKRLVESGQDEPPESPISPISRPYRPRRSSAASSTETRPGASRPPWKNWSSIFR